MNKLDIEKEVKRAKSLQKTPEGRAALREVYKVNVEPLSQVDRPIVAILVPCYKSPHPRMTHCLNMMVDYTRKAGVAHVFMEPYQQTSVVHWSRNGLLASLIRSGKPFTHVLFLDDDIAAPEDGLVRLLAHGKDIVAGLCTRRCDPPIPNMRLINMETCAVGEVWKWETGTLLGDKVPEGHAFAIGTGMMLISRDALQKTADAYVNADYEKEVYALPDEAIASIKVIREDRFNQLGNGWWFDFARPRADFDEFGEDIYFCWFAKKFCDIKTYIDTAVLPEHWGEYGYAIVDYIANRDEAIHRAKAKGSYIPPALVDSEIMSAVQEQPKISVIG